jgi:hypothetical protein
MKVWMLLFLTLSYSAFSSEFVHIKLSPEFEKFLIQPLPRTMPDTGLRAKSIQSLSTNSPLTQPSLSLESRMKTALLGSALSLSGNMTGPIPIDGEESPLYEEIRQHLESAHQNIGLREIQTINRLNQQFNLGMANYAGFSWQKPFGVFQVYADRQVTPNLFGQNWLIMDTFTFEVEASTFLEKLTQAGLTAMNSTDIAAFAGITFRRVYTYWHYASSYQNGLGADLSKLFLPFMKFNPSSMERMESGEIMKREDTWTTNAGGLISTPPLYNLSFSAGALAQSDYQSVTSIQKNPTKEHLFRLGVVAKKTASAGATLELQLDFFKLLKLSLLRYDMNYEYASGKEFTLGFAPEHWASLKNDNEGAAEIRSLLGGRGSVKKLEPFVVRLDESSSSSFEQRGSLLLWGKMQKQKTEQIRVIKDNISRVFYKNYSQNVKVVQNLFSRIFSAIVYKLLKLPLGVNNAAVYSRQLTMEYEATHAQATDPNVIRIDGAEQFSFVLTQYYNAARTDRWLDRKFKNDLIWFLDNFTTLPKTYKTDIRNEVLRGPMIIESNLRVERAGFMYLVNADSNLIFSIIAKVCGSSKREEWANESKRPSLMEGKQVGEEECVQSIGQKYLGFRDDYLSNYLKPSLAKFKDFITQFYKNSDELADLEQIFGRENTFINGRLQASTSVGMPFSTTFSSGQFRGLGVIDNFKRAEGSRVPASIVSE